MDTKKLQGASHEQGGIPIEAEGGERIFSVEDTNKMESLAQGDKFQQLGQFIKSAMGKQDSRPLDYKGMAEHGAKMFDSSDNKLPFNLSEKEHGILNQYAVYNNSVTPDMLNANVAKTIMARSGLNTSKIANIPSSLIQSNPNNASLKNNNPGNIMYYTKNKAGKLSTKPSGYAKYLISQGYSISAGSSNKDGQFIKFNNLDDGLNAKLGFWGYMKTKPIYKGKTLDEALMLYSGNGYDAKALGLDQYSSTTIDKISDNVWNEISANQLKREDNVMYSHIFGSTAPNKINFSNFSSQAGAQANKPFAFEDAPIKAGSEVTGREQETVFSTPSYVTAPKPKGFWEKARSGEPGTRSYVLSPEELEAAGGQEIDREKQEKLDQLNSYKKNIKSQEQLIKDKQKHNKVLEEEIKSTTGKWAMKTVSSPLLIGKEKHNELKEHNSNIKKEKEKLKQQKKQNSSTIEQLLKDRNTQLNKINDEYYKPEIDKLNAHLNSASTEDYDYNGTKLNRDQIKQKIKELGSIKDTQIKANQHSGAFGGDIAFISDDDKWDVIGPQLAQVPTTSGQISSKVTTGQAPAGITTPPMPTTGATSAAATAAGKDSKQDVIDKINKWDPEKNITGEATTTYEDLFADDRTSGQKTKDFLLNNAMNMAEVIGGIAGASKNLPRFMIPDQLIEQAREINERAQTGLTAEEKSLMIRDAVEKEQTAYNVLGGSGLSSGQMLGIAPQLQRQTQDQKLKIDILDEQTREKYEEKSTNMEKYLSDIQYKTQFMPDYQEAQMDKQGAAMMAQSGMQGIQENMMYEKQFGKGTAYSAIQQATTKNIVEEIRAKEMAQSKGIQEADYLDSLDAQRKQAIQGITNMPQIDYDNFDISNINKIIEQFNL